MSCIKFPSTKNDLTKSLNKENVKDYDVSKSQLIAIANQVFGEGNWSHAITNQTVDFVEYITGKYQSGCVSIVRVQLKDGTFHEDMGYNNSEGSTKGSAVEKSRKGSTTDALKKVLMCFGSGITNKIKGLSSRPSSPIPPEIIPNKLPPEIITNKLSPEIISNKLPPEIISNKLPQTTSSTITKPISVEPFEEVIPMSQTDAFMDTVDLDEFNKDQNSNTINLPPKNIKENGLKPSKTPLSTVVNDKNKNSSSSIKEKNIKVDVPKIIVPTGTNNVVNKDSVAQASIKESKPEVPKAVVQTAMTEEEMRLYRKRKQREMQEEFKRKEQNKKIAGDNGNKPTPNPRY